MPNTNPTDLDREALEKAYDAHCRRSLNPITMASAEHLIRSYREALPRASGVPEAEAEAVVWQWRPKGSKYWISDPTQNWLDRQGDAVEKRALYASHPPVAAPSGEAKATSWAHVAERPFHELPDGLREPLHGLQADLDWILARYITEDDEVRGMLKNSIVNRLSQIESASYRLANPFPSPIANEPKDAGLSAKAKGGIKILSDEEEIAMLTATDQLLSGSLAIVALDNLHAAGFAITRTAPSGAKPGEVG